MSRGTDWAEIKIIYDRSQNAHIHPKQLGIEGAYVWYRETNSERYKEREKWIDIEIQ